MKEFVILRGLPGSGKSTFAELLTLGRESSIVIENDQFLYEDGIYVWKESKMKGAYRAAREKFEKAVKDGVQLIVLANVHVRESDFQYHAELAKKNGYKITTVIVENRNETKSLHGLDDKKMKRMGEFFQVKLK